MDLKTRYYDNSKGKSQLRIILEFKKVGKEELLIKKSDDGLKQIFEKNYEDEMKSLGINEVSKIGISFCGKECEMVLP